MTPAAPTESPVEWIGQRDREAIGRLGERQDARLLEEVGTDPLAMQRQVGIVGLAGERQIEQLRQRLGHVALGHEAERAHYLVQVLAARLASPQRAVESGAVELAALDQQLAKGLIEAVRLVMATAAIGYLRQVAGDHRPDR